MSDEESDSEFSETSENLDLAELNPRIQLESPSEIEFLENQPGGIKLPEEDNFGMMLKPYQSPDQSNAPIFITLLFVLTVCILGFNNRRKIIGYIIEGTRASANKRRNYQYSRLNA